MWRMSLTFTEGRHVPRGVAADIGANGGEQFRGVDRAHHLAATRRNSRTQQQAIKVDAFVAQGSHSFTLMTVGRQALHIVELARSRAKQAGPGR